MKYIYLKSTSKHTGKPTERGLYRAGETVELANLGVEKALLIQYNDNTATVTSNVESIVQDEEGLVIETLNTIYEFSWVG